MIGEKNLIEYFHKGRKANKRITDSITSWYEKITFVVEQNGEVNLVEMEHDDNTLLWIWNTKWKPATINGENVRCRIEKTFYYK